MNENKKFTKYGENPVDIVKKVNDTIGEMKYEGKREEFKTGACRESHKGKGRYDLISPIGLKRIADWYEAGAIKYGARNWEKGIPTSNCLNSMFRHMVKYMNGQREEDHLSAIAWNAFAIMHMEENFPEMCDLPNKLNTK